MLNYSVEHKTYVSLAPGPLHFFLNQLCDLLLYLHKTKCCANVGRGHLVSLFHKQNVAFSCACSTVRMYRVCDRCSLVITRADTSFTVPITTPMLHDYVKNAYYNVGNTTMKTGC